MYESHRIRMAVAGIGLMQGGARSSHHPQSLIQLMDRLFVAAGVIYLALFAYFAVRASILSPFTDMIDLVNDYFRALDQGQFIEHLFPPRNYHRIVWFRGLVALDVSLFRGTGLPLVITAAMCQAGIALVLAYEVRRVARGLVVPLAILAAMLVYLTANAGDVSQAVNTAYIRTTFFAVLALAIASSAAQRRADWRRWAAAIAAAAAASFCLAVSLALWPIFALMAWRGKASQLTTILVTAVGVVFCTAYMSGQPVGAALQHGLDSRGLRNAAAYFLAYLGLPWTRGALLPGQLLGAGLLAASLFALARYGRRQSTRTQRLALGMILFSLGSAVLAAAGRSYMSAEINVPVRYAILMTPLHAAFLLLIAPAILQAWERCPCYVAYGLIAALALLMVQQALVGPVVVRAAERVRETIVLFHEGGRTPEMLRSVHPDLGIAEAGYAEMRRRGVYLQWIGGPSDSTASVAPGANASSEGGQ